MPDSRRSPRASRPRSRSGPGRVPGATSGGAMRGGRSAGAPVRGAAGREEPQRPRFTGRMLVLVLVVAVLAVSYASSLRAYLQQRAHIEALKADISERQASINDLEREKRRWNDDAYVEAQARERFGFLMPGETSYVVLGEDGKPLESQTELPDASDVGQQPPEAWWGKAWDSVVLAGEPPRATPPPATEIDAPAGERGSGAGE
ncbi:FtsB family cell division protein [Nocardioides taihuensis]|uniref:Septum formation initiator family protein n=1 Tax=Nocardioides taihuensis TaxID=1835606 RepID=A0ABW0BKX3_9ACTN